MSHEQPVPVIFTIGHSNHAIERFLQLLHAYEIETLADIRSNPASRFSPHFNQPALRASVQSRGLLYLYLGDRLGGMPADPAFHDEGALDLLTLEAGIGRTAIMCAEDDPRKCHRYHLVTPRLVERGFTVLHIRADGRLETQDDLDRGQMGLDV